MATEEWISGCWRILIALINSWWIRFGFRMAFMDPNFGWQSMVECANLIQICSSSTPHFWEWFLWLSLFPPTPRPSATDTHTLFKFVGLFTRKNEVFPYGNAGQIGGWGHTHTQAIHMECVSRAHAIGYVWSLWWNYNQPIVTMAFVCIDWRFIWSVGLI